MWKLAYISGVAGVSSALFFINYRFMTPVIFKYGGCEQEANNMFSLWKKCTSLRSFALIKKYELFCMFGFPISVDIFISLFLHFFSKCHKPININLNRDKNKHFPVKVYYLNSSKSSYYKFTRNCYKYTGWNVYSAIGDYLNEIVLIHTK